MALCSHLPVTSTQKSMQEKIDLQVCRFLIATDSPFALVENRHFRKLLSDLRSGVQIADRRAMAGRLLDKVYEEEHGKLAILVKGCCVTLCVDGWSLMQAI